LWDFCRDCEELLQVFISQPLFPDSKPKIRLVEYNFPEQSIEPNRINPALLTYPARLFPSHKLLGRDAGADDEKQRENQKINRRIYSRERENDFGHENQRSRETSHEGQCGWHEEHWWKRHEK
jgi:hypothetical protein